MKDHLGNVRAIVDDTKVPKGTAGNLNTWLFAANISNIFNYYPFGKLYPGTGIYNRLEDYSFGFNGMRRDDDIKEKGGVYNHGARLISNDVPMWFSRDPKESSFPWSSPYVAFGNNPINAIDPDGRIVVFVNGYQGSQAVMLDLLDITGLGRYLYRMFTQEEIYKSDDGYWNGMDKKFMARIGDNNAVYADASSHAFSTASYRYDRGVEAGETMLKKINSGEIELQKDKDGNVTETIKIVSHSQGGAYAAGMSNVLTKAGYAVEVEYNLAPKQPEDIPITKAQRRVQYGSPDDFIAPQNDMPGVKENLQDVPKNLRGIITGGGHILNSYDYIFKKPVTEDGYVAPRKDKQAPKEKKNGGNLLHLLFLFLIFIGTSCKSLEEQMQCLEEQHLEIKETNVYNTVYTSFSDTLQIWRNLNLEFISRLKIVDWKVDSTILFNITRDKCLLFLLKRDTVTGAVHDNIKILLGVKNIHWKFFYYGMPSLTAIRERVGKSEPFSFEELSEMALHQVIQGGYFEKYTCNINDDYVNGWYDQYKEKLHVEFLQSGIKPEK